MGDKVELKSLKEKILVWVVWFGMWFVSIGSTIGSTIGGVHWCYW